MPQKRSENEHKDCPGNIAVVQGGRVISGCELCIGRKQSQGNSAAYERNWQRREYARDTIQPNQPEQFAREYPQQARELGYTDEMMRKFG